MGVEFIIVIKLLCYFFLFYCLFILLFIDFIKYVVGCEMYLLGFGLIIEYIIDGN